MKRIKLIALGLGLIILNADQSFAAKTCAEAATIKAQRAAKTAATKCTSAQRAVTVAQNAVARYEARVASATTEKIKSLMQLKLASAKAAKADRQAKANLKCDAATVVSGQIASAASVCASDPFARPAGSTTTNPAGTGSTGNFVPPTSNTSNGSIRGNGGVTPPPVDSGVRGSGSTPPPVDSGVRGSGSTTAPVTNNTGVRGGGTGQSIPVPLDPDGGSRLAPLPEIE